MSKSSSRGYFSSNGVMVGGGLCDLNCEVCGEYDESGMAGTGVDCVIGVLGGVV